MTKSAKNHKRAWDYFVSIGKIPADAKPREYALHHKDVKLKTENPERYNQWNIEDLEVLTHSEHSHLHSSMYHPKGMLGKHHSEETLQHYRNTRKGRHHSDETKRKISEACKGKLRSEETKRKISEIAKGRKGSMLGKHHSDETKRKISEAQKGANNHWFGMHWYNDGSKNVRAKECPEGFVHGRI